MRICDCAGHIGFGDHLSFWQKKIMAEPATTEVQQANSPARQLLAALTRASQDMERSVSDTCEYVSRLNGDLERFVNGQLEAADEQVEQFVRTKLEKISTEKETVLSQLMEIRQEELQVLQQTGKALRDTLGKKLDELVGNFDKEIDLNLKAFQKQLTDSETQMNTRVSESRSEFRANMPGNLKSIRDDVGAEKSALEELHGGYDKQLSEESTSSLEQLVEHCIELRSRLQNEGEDYLGSVTSSVDNLTAQQTQRLNQRIESFSSMQKSVSERIHSLSEADISYVKELPTTFSQSCKEMTELQVGLHATMVRNLALQYRTEILSAAQQAEDQLAIVRADLQALLRNYQNHYSEQFDNLLAKFEKAAAELSHEETVAPDQAIDNELIASLEEQFATLKKGLLEETKNGIAGVESYMEKSYEKFRVQLDSAKKDVGEHIEKSFHENQNEFSKLQHSNDEQINELARKLEELELSVAEARELISALDEASLDF